MYLECKVEATVSQKKAYCRSPRGGGGTAVVRGARHMGAASADAFSPVGWFENFDARVEVTILAVAVVALGAVVLYEHLFCEKRKTA